MSRSFRLAPMSPVIKTITIAVLILPLFFGIWAMVSPSGLPALLFFLLILLFAGVWFWCRPSRFLVSPDTLGILFPRWTRQIRVTDISGVEVMDKETFGDRFGTAIRIGVGGLWGGFGWLWTSKQGLIEFYISQLNEFVWIERRTGRGLLITPENPTEFCEVLQSFIQTASNENDYD